MGGDWREARVVVSMPRIGFRPASGLDLAKPDGRQPTVRPMPESNYPRKAIVSTATAHALFYTPEHALRYQHHPGSLPALVDTYMRWINDTEVQGV